jgi:hypothetical protein
MAKIIDSLVEMLAAKQAKLPAGVVQRAKPRSRFPGCDCFGSRLKPGRLGLQHARAGGRKKAACSGRI